jgi:chorismate mutase
LKTALHIPVEDRGREEEIIQRLGELADGNLKEEQLIKIFTAVFKSSKQIQE